MAKYLRATITYELLISDNTDTDKAQEELYDLIANDVFDGTIWQNITTESVTKSLSEELDNR